MEKYNVYCIKEYFEYYSNTYVRTVSPYEYHFSEGKIYECEKDGLYVMITDDNYNVMRYNINSPFAENGYGKHFISIKELRRTKLNTLNSIL